MTPKAAAGQLVPVPDRSSARKAEYRVKQLTAAEKRAPVAQLAAESAATGTLKL